MFIYLLLTANGFVPGASGTTITKKTQNNTKHSKEYVTHAITNNSQNLKNYLFIYFNFLKSIIAQSV